MANVAFIGLGTMGLVMARNIIEGGHQVTGYDTDADASQIMSPMVVPQPHRQLMRLMAPRSSLPCCRLAKS